MRQPLQIILLICMSIALLQARAAADDCSAPDPDAIVPRTEDARMALLGRARIWMEDLRGDRSLLQGPLQPEPEDRFNLNQQIRCEFIEPENMKRPGGATEKFLCDYNGRTLWLKYHTRAEYNPGVWGEVLGTRLFWALGLPADAVYPVNIICENCPQEPWLYIQNYFRATYPEETLAMAYSDAHREQLKETFPKAREYVETHRHKRVTKAIDIAQIKFRYPARTIEQCEEQGWNWAEEFEHIDVSNAETRRRLRVERDAMALLAAFIQHADNKPAQQRLFCASAIENETICSDPVMMIQDLGFIFGGGRERSARMGTDGKQIRGVFSSINLEKWLDAPLWQNPVQCVTEVRYMVGGNQIARSVSEEGRQFLAARLQPLLENEQDLRDLFTAANISLRPVNVRDADGNVYKNGYSVDEWIAGFKTRAQSIIDHRCPLLEDQIN